MKAFIAVFAIVLLAFGASILYYRGDFGLSKKTPVTTVSQTPSNSTATPPTNPGSAFDIAKGPATPPEVLGLPATQPVYTLLSIKRGFEGNVEVGSSLDLKVMAKDSGEALVNVEGTWSVSDSSVGSLSGASGTSVTFNGLKPGTAKITAKYRSLVNSINVMVVAKVLGATATPVTPAKPAVTAVEIRLYDTNGSRLNNGDTRTYTAQVYYSDGTLKSVDVNWSVDPTDLGSLSRTKGSSVDFKASRSGSGNLKATLGNLSTSLYVQVN